MIRTEWRLEMRLKSPTMLKQYMQYKHMTIRQLATSAGVSKSTVGYLCTGKRHGGCSPITARKIEEALACPAGLLFEPRSSNVSRETAA